MKHLEFDPSEIEDEVYSRLDDSVQSSMAKPEVLKEMRIILVRRAGKVLENDQMNSVNFQMF